MIARIFKYVLVCVIAVCVLGVAPKTDFGLSDADFYLRYLVLNRAQKANPEYRSISNVILIAPEWYKQFCEKFDFNLDCKKEALASDELLHIIEIFSLCKYNSQKGGAIEEALTFARNNLPLTFEILDEVKARYPKEFRFDFIRGIKKEMIYWEQHLREMPIKESVKVRLKDKDYTLTYRAKNNKHSVVVLDDQGKEVFTDGPRWIMHPKDPARRELSTSMTVTWTDLAHRGSGIYQYALKYYLQKLNISNVWLYTENEETLEFIYRMKQLIFRPSGRELLLNILGVREYLTVLGISIEDFKSGDLAKLYEAEEAMNYLSLQGRTRLNINMSFEVDLNEPAIIHSQPIDDSRVAQIKSAMKDLEGKIESEYLSGNPGSAVFQLPVSYLQKFKPKPKDPSHGCVSALKKPA